MNKKRYVSFPLALAAIWLTAATMIQDVARADENEVWRLRNDRGNRFEGRRAVTVKRPDLELVSFVGFSEDYYAQDVELKVKFFLSEAAPVTLVAREIKEETQYWMEAKPWASRGASWNEWGPWRTGAVLRRENIPSSNLGVLVKLEDVADQSLADHSLADQSLEDQNLADQSLAPAFVYYSKPPHSVKTYSVHIRPNAPLLGASYSLHRREGVEILRGEAEVGDFESPFEIRLDVRDVEDGFLKLEIQTRIKGRHKSASREYQFFHKKDLRSEAFP